VQGISILIPARNHKVADLARSLQQQCLGICSYEIIIADDASDNPDLCDFDKLSMIPNCYIICNETRQGRSITRQILSDKAQHGILLFIDADAAVIRPDFINKYLCALRNADVACGGTAYCGKMPAYGLLRWKYGRRREQKTAQERQKLGYRQFSSFNFAIKKKLLLNLGFGHGLNVYGHEDTCLGIDLEKAGAKLLHIDNPAMHCGLESSLDFTLKTKEAAAALAYLYNSTHYRNSLASNSAALRASLKIRSLITARFCRKIAAPVGMLAAKYAAKHNSLAALDILKIATLCTLLQQ
jgi:glycosyltransferase involved in cell wall biosynthesis